MLSFSFKYLSTLLKGNTMPYKILGILLLIGACLFYFNYSQEKIQELSADIAEFEMVKEEHETTIRTLKSNASEQQRLNTNLQIKLKQAEKSNDDLRTLLRKHNLEMLALKKPNLIEQRINNATEQVFKDITDITTD